MRWELISLFDDFLDDFGNVTEDQPRRELTVWELRRQVKVVFYREQDDERIHERGHIWLDHKDIEEVIDYLKSGQRNSYNTVEEITNLIRELERIKEWLNHYTHLAERD